MKLLSAEHEACLNRGFPRKLGKEKKAQIDYIKKEERGGPPRWSCMTGAHPF